MEFFGKMRKLLCLLIVGLFVTVGCSSPSDSPVVGPLGSGKRHFTRLGFATNCLFVNDVNGQDQWGGVEGASRNGKPGSSCLRSGYDKSVILSSQMSINGNPVTPKAVYVYTLVPNHPVGTPQVPPDKVALIGTAVQWQCGPGSPRHSAPYACDPGVYTQAWVTLPSCLDGTNQLYPTCPDGVTQLPVIQLQFSWPVSDATQATFSGGSYSASWANGWLPAAIDSLVANCIVIPTACGSVVNYFHNSPLPK